MSTKVRRKEGELLASWQRVLPHSRAQYRYPGPQTVARMGCNIPLINITIASQVVGKTQDSVAFFYAARRRVFQIRENRPQQNPSCRFTHDVDVICR